VLLVGAVLIGGSVGLGISLGWVGGFMTRHPDFPNGNRESGQRIGPRRVRLYRRLRPWLALTLVTGLVLFGIGVWKDR
jgi:hypothetical protein